ncbi:hypothetical protein [Thermocoleostomius sinensis]|jgi:hypothetical protein|uniref:Uncharacterized protein n=1 Tax=Thermocoleostomius sinensis A174 TaxID=2016057 RepID=A0A9E9CB83_9CYAN|nr:hypothetical protein [Thermocoleostomius sinensis]WAL60035.1 hypothetical protein OXH18_23155 [Thermocoleostomius sinensis A174]
MARQLKRWESPRREGRNNKGRGGTARKRQRQKQLKNLSKKLKQGEIGSSTSQHKFNTNQKEREGREPSVSSLFYLMLNKPGKYSALRKPIIASAVSCTTRSSQNQFKVDRYSVWTYF